MIKCHFKGCLRVQSIALNETVLVTELALDMTLILLLVISWDWFGSMVHHLLVEVMLLLSFHHDTYDVVLLARTDIGWQDEEVSLLQHLLFVGVEDERLLIADVLLDDAWPSLLIGLVVFLKCILTCVLL